MTTASNTATAGWSARLGKLGFDRGRLTFALRTAIGACIALVFAWAIGLDHPQWAAMTVWAASQPTRGQLLEKGFFRVAGTVSGASAGICLMLISHGSPYIIAPGLAIWVGLCAGIGNLQRGFVSYGTIVAGYSAAMVVLLDNVHPDHVFALGFDRMATILVGVVVSLAVSWLLTSYAEESVISARLKALSARLLREMSTSLRGGAPLRRREQALLLAELAALESALEPHGAGSLRSRQLVKKIRGVLIAEMALLLWLRDGPTRHWPENVAEELERAAIAAETSSDPHDLVTHISAAIDACRNAYASSEATAPLETVLLPLEAAIRDYLFEKEADSARTAQAYRKPVVLHQDYIGAREAAIRAFSAMLAVGLFWAFTGFSSAPYMLLGLSIMLSMFSTFDSPGAMMPFVFLGQSAGALTSVFCHWVLWPHAINAFEMVLMMMPFVILGAFVMGHRRTVRIAFDYNMVFLLLSTPVFPLTGTLAGSVIGAVSVAAAPIIAFAVYRVIYPTDAKRRMDMLRLSIVETLQAIAADPNAEAKREVERARLYARILRLVRWQERKIEAIEPVADAGLAALNLGSVIYDLHAANKRSPIDETLRISSVLEAIMTVSAKPERTALMLAHLAARLPEDGPLNAERFRSASRGIAENAAFFRKA